MTEEAFKRALEFAAHHQTDTLAVGGPDGDAVSIGRPEELGESAREVLEAIIQDFAPWRKGPFELFGRRIDANWKSDLKWNRLISYLGADFLEDKVIADVGANNGYFMYRLALAGARRVLGLDPAPVFARMYEFLSALHPTPNLEFRQAGFESMAGDPKTFEIIFCMGVIYHHTDPMQLLRILHGALQTGGTLVLESMCIAPPGERFDFQEFNAERAESPVPGLDSFYSLVPGGKYAGAKAVWNVPTPGALFNWVRRAGFRDITVRCIHRYEHEQERRELADLPGLREFLDPADPRQTREGYPAPFRIHLTARR